MDRQFTQKLKQFAILVSSVLGIALLAGLSLIAILLGIDHSESIINSNQVNTVSYRSESGAEINLTVEIADDEQSRATGLMHREYLAPNTGMLFIYSNSEPREFWMKNTLISLDLLFMDEAGKIVNIHQHTVPNQSQVLYSSGAPAKYALEVEAGWVNRSGISVGDFLHIL